VGVDADAAQGDGWFLGNHRGDVGHDADVVVAHHLQGNGVVRAFGLAGPAGFDDAVTEALHHLGGVGAVGAVYLDAACGGHETEDIVAVDGVATAGQLVIDAGELLVDEHHIFLARSGFNRGIHVEALGRAAFAGVVCAAFGFFNLEVEVDDGVDIEAFGADFSKKVGDRLELELLDYFHEQAFVVVDLPVF